MMKKLLIIFLILFTFGCSKGNDIKEEYEKNAIDVSILDGTLTDSGFILDVKNNGSSDIVLSPDFDIEKNNNGNFEKLSKNKKCSSGIGYGIESNNIMSVKVNWLCEYGNLDSGKYRFIKYLDNGEYFIVEFEL